jgi:hypothetical protein
MARSTADRLAAYERRYRHLAAQIAEIGFISSGSVTHRYTRCGTAGCRCHADPPQLHGPYYQREHPPFWRTPRIGGVHVGEEEVERRSSVEVLARVPA